MKKYIIIILIFISGSSIAQNNFINDKQNPGKKDKKEKWEENLSDFVMLEGVYHRNLGEFGQIYNKGNGLYLNYGKHFNNTYLVVFKTGYTDYKSRDGALEDSSAFNTVPIQIGGRYYFMSSRFMPYISFVNGFNIISQERNIHGISDSQTLLRYMWQLGMGVSVKVIKEFSIDLSAKYNNNFYEPEAMMTSFEYSGGLTVSLW